MKMFAGLLALCALMLCGIASAAIYDNSVTVNGPAIQWDNLVWAGGQWYQSSGTPYVGTTDALTVDAQVQGFVSYKVDQTNVSFNVANNLFNSAGVAGTITGYTDSNIGFPVMLEFGATVAGCDMTNLLKDDNHAVKIPVTWKYTNNGGAPALMDTSTAGVVRGILGDGRHDFTVICTVTPANDQAIGHYTLDPTISVIPTL